MVTCKLVPDFSLLLKPSIMKPLIIICCFLTIFSSSSYSQSISIGPKIGVNITNWSTNFDDIGTGIGYHLGAFGNYQLIDQVSLQAELLFTGMGARDIGGSNHGNIITNFIGLPLLANYHINEEITVHGGLEFDFLLSAKTNFTKGPKEGIKQDEKDRFNALGIAFILGGEYQFSENVKAGLRIHLGLNNISSEPTDQIKNRVIQLYAAFPLLSLEAN